MIYILEQGKRGTPLQKKEEFFVGIHLVQEWKFCILRTGG